MPDYKADDVLAALPARYRQMVDRSTAQGLDLTRAVTMAFAIMAHTQPQLYKSIVRKLDQQRKQQQS